MRINDALVCLLLEQVLREVARSHIRDVRFIKSVQGIACDSQLFLS
jgi:hypothetical protein